MNLTKLILILESTDPHTYCNIFYLQINGDSRIMKEHRNSEYYTMKFLLKFFKFHYSEY